MDVATDEPTCFSSTASSSFPFFFREQKSIPTSYLTAMGNGRGRLYSTTDTTVLHQGRSNAISFQSC